MVYRLCATASRHLDSASLEAWDGAIYTSNLEMRA
jgi:hypothetical protein